MSTKSKFFKKGDYIVVTYISPTMNDIAKSGYVYKQRINSVNLCPSRDHLYRTGKTSLSVLSDFNVGGYGGRGVEWRKATSEEIKRYDIECGPYDINNEELKQSYIITSMIYDLEIIENSRKDE